MKHAVVAGATVLVTLGAVGIWFSWLMRDWPQTFDWQVLTGLCGAIPMLAAIATFGLVLARRAR